MAIIEKPIRLETTKQNLVQAVIAKQGDSNSRYLKVTFLDEGSVIPLDSSSQVTINAEREDGTSQSFFGVVNGDDTATVPLHSWILELDGVVNCDISIIGADSRLTTTTFVVKVEKAACSSGDISTDPQYDVLANLINDVNAAKNGTANAIVGTASGTLVAMKDVSPLEHPIGVKLSSDTVTDFSSVTLTKHGKNLYDSTYKAGNTGVYNGWLLRDENSKWNGLVDIDTVPDVFTLSTKVVCGDYGTSGTNLRLNYYDADKNYLSLKVGTNATAGNPITTVVFNRAAVPSGTKYVEFLIRINSAGYNTDTQIELGTTATEYEPYKEPISYTPKADGTVDGVTSLYPTTTLLTDTEGVTITAEYNRDTNKVIESLVNAIISLGGNV